MVCIVAAPKASVFSAIILSDASMIRSWIAGLVDAFFGGPGGNRQVHVQHVADRRRVRPSVSQASG